jgi:hypothetical protein
MTAERGLSVEVRVTRFAARALQAAAPWARSRVSWERIILLLAPMTPSDGCRIIVTTEEQ